MTELSYFLSGLLNLKLEIESFKASKEIQMKKKNVLILLDFFSRNKSNTNTFSNSCLSIYLSSAI